ncbi:sorting nexin-11-like isoform X2 [Dreissena polymorpha]|uniref:PX domain-containing protein n=2 Tax=Dreissena polymorpha TaxID=45954 RepID=A0A9D4BEQ5_DREPO|nr:sorting nexin-11-like isoform X2 [Dreissena polymorpha]XP_052254082.1 sorting nexin-11-like isoform X2 [Dreissena polymorpha]XP_052254083.1 sorting nexin-11-like isoform X2 [Dreissena polymorpha]XP_052254084.1 sorting nexin-11-like isoform X2 [Dreissena polymorpha]KAH3700260.1 hypothetical protein DPMN_075233 [Dreissena polymorpha]
MESDLDICVCNPCTDKFTTYEILIKTSNPAFTLRKSRTRRRYNDFCWLKNILKSHHPVCLCPELPEKNNSSERFEPQFVVDRMTKLGEWLSSIVNISLYLSDSALHLFLQTTLTCNQIDLYLKGSLAEEDVAKGYRSAMMKKSDSTTSSPRHSGDPTELDQSTNPESARHQADQSTNADLISHQPVPEASESAENQSISQNGDITLNHESAENQSISQNGEIPLNHDSAQNQSISQNGDVTLDHESAENQTISQNGDIPLNHESAESQSISQNGDVTLDHESAKNQSISQNGDITVNHGSDLELSLSIESSEDSSISSSADLETFASNYPQVTEVQTDVNKCGADSTSTCVQDTDSAVFSGEGSISEENKAKSKVDKGVIFSIN